MSAPSVTYTFSNSTTADASQVNQNFTDLINGVSDGTKDLSINALTLAGALTANGNLTIGNASSDDFTVTASIASSVAIKTTFSYDLGSSTIGWKSFYLGSDDSAAKSVRVIAGTIGTSYTLTLPTSGGTNRYRLETNGSGVTSWQPTWRSSDDIQNLGITATVAASALTVTLVGANGSAPSTTNPTDIVTRNSTAATGTPSTATATSGVSALVIGSGSTLGHASAVQSYIWVYALNNAGAIEPAVSSILYPDGSVVTTVAEANSSAADSISAIYSTTQRTGFPIRLVGRLSSTQATAGTWATAISEISLITPANAKETVAFCATTTATTPSTTFTTLVYSAVVKDSHNSYSTSTGGYTVPRAGWYSVGGSCMVTSDLVLNNAVQFSLFIDSVQDKGAFYRASATQAGFIANVTISTIIYCAAGVVLTLRALSPGANRASNSSTTFEYFYVASLSAL